MSLRLTLQIALSCVALACSGGEPPAAQEQQRDLPTHGLVAPLRAELLGPAAAPSRGPLQIALRLERAAGFRAPARVRVESPPGVRLAAGGLEADLFAPAGTTRLVYDFYVERVPERDLTFRVDARMRAAGYHATLHYGFGRTRSLPAALRVTGPHVRVGRTDIGAAIEVRPR